MSDDLVKRLRGYGSNRYWPHGPACDCTQAADRIEELEAKLEKVTDVALRLYYGTGVVTADMHATLAKLAGGKDE